MTNPVQLIPPKVRLAIYLVVFLLSLALTAWGNYYTTLDQPIPDFIRGLSGGVLPPITAVFSAVAASNTTKAATAQDTVSAADVKATLDQIAEFLAAQRQPEPLVNAGGGVTPDGYGSGV